MKHIILALFALITLTACSQTAQRNDTKDQTVVMLQPQEFKNQIESDDVILVDVRTPEEYNEGHINDAMNIDFMNDTFAEEIQKLDKTKPVYIYCRSGGRSGEAAKEMSELGFEKVYDLSGGIKNYNE